MMIISSLGGREVLEMAWLLVFSMFFSLFLFLLVGGGGGVDICRWHTNHNDIYCLLIGCTHLSAVENDGT